jgi:hypothetical protein
MDNFTTQVRPPLNFSIRDLWNGEMTDEVRTKFEQLKKTCEDKTSDQVAQG